MRPRRSPRTTRIEIPPAPTDLWPLRFGLLSLVGWCCALASYPLGGFLLAFLLPFASLTAVLGGAGVLWRLRGTANSRRSPLIGMALGLLGLWIAWYHFVIWM
ncbi:hypothetical protein AB0K02_28485 [Streptomyces sp. NPDC049597]|uniref:hypothetical protein n=1 Tax=Streptomyces sp. NPDC049597 TaxID=3155276 RepID=UPI003431043D